MAAKNTYRLRLIRSLMIISEVLLLFAASAWLYSQYANEKQELVKELSQRFIDAQDNALDSLIFKNMVDPMLSKASELYRDTTQRGGVRQITLQNNAVEIVLNDKKVNIGAPDSFKHKMKVIKYADTMVLPVSKRGNFNISMFDMKGSPEQAKNMLQPVVNFVVRQMRNGEMQANEHVKMGDTALLKKIFTKNMSKEHASFSVTWVKAMPADNSKQIYIAANFLYPSFFVGIGNYYWYIVGKILPQLLFALLLLAIIAVAFGVTYRMLKQQIKLGIMKNDLISNMSHELNTPISTVKVALEALGNYNMIDDPGKTKDYLEMAEAEMNRLDMLVKQSLNTALADEGRLPITKSQQDLKLFISKTIESVKAVYQEEVSIDFHAEAKPFIATIDTLHMQGVLQNLIDNSIKYCPAPVLIDIQLREEMNSFTIAVSDNGPGIPEADIKHVFDRFFRVSSGDIHNVKGYGLGLSYARQIVEAHGGSIGASNNADKGCTFTIKIPR